MVNTLTIHNSALYGVL